MLLAVLLAAAAVLLWLMVQRREDEREAACSAPATQVIYTGECTVMGEKAVQKAAGENAEAAIQRASAILQELERQWSPECADSAAGQIAADAGLKATVLGEEEFALLQRGFALSEESGGLFDVTAAPLRKLWAEGEPAADQIGSALSLVGWETAVLNPDERSILLPRPGAAVDLSGILWGCAAEQLMAVYEEENLQGAQASFGGMQLLYGQLEEGVPLTAEIRDGDGTVLGTFTGEKMIAATRNEPVLDPRTGKMAETDLTSVTVFAEDPVYADYLADIIYVGGTAGLAPHLEAEYGVAAADSSGALYVSLSLDGVFTAAGDGEGAAP